MRRTALLSLLLSVAACSGSDGSGSPAAPQSYPAVGGTYQAGFDYSGTVADTATGGGTRSVSITGSAALTVSDPAAGLVAGTFRMTDVELVVGVDTVAMGDLFGAWNGRVGTLANPTVSIPQGLVAGPDGSGPRDCPGQTAPLTSFTITTGAAAQLPVQFHTPDMPTSCDLFGYLSVPLTLDFVTP